MKASMGVRTQSRSFTAGTAGRASGRSDHQSPLGAGSAPRAVAAASNTSQTRVREPRRMAASLGGSVLQGDPAGQVGG